MTVDQAGHPYDHDASMTIISAVQQIMQMLAACKRQDYCASLLKAALHTKTFLHLCDISSMSNGTVLYNIHEQWRPKKDCPLLSRSSIDGSSQYCTHELMRKARSSQVQEAARRPWRPKQSRKPSSFMPTGKYVGIYKRGLHL